MKDYYFFNNSKNKKWRVRNCGVPYCNGKHFIKFSDGKAIIPIWELFQIGKHWKKNIKKTYNIVCKKEDLHHLHKKLDVFTFFTNYIRDRNINRNDFLSKILRDNCRHPFCLNSWCFKIFVTKWIIDEKTLTYRAAHFL